MLTTAREHVYHSVHILSHFEYDNLRQHTTICHRNVTKPLTMVMVLSVSRMLFVCFIICFCPTDECSPRASLIALSDYVFVYTTCCVSVWNKFKSDIACIIILCIH